MPWKETSVVEERMRFVMDYQSGEWTMAELCRNYGISRPTGYSFIDRFEREGIAGLQDRSRAPGWHPNQIAREIEEQILQLRRERPRWGPKKLQAHLRKKQPQTAWPALSTIGDLLHREGLTVPPPKRRRIPPYTEAFVAIEGSNQTWCMDFKGWFRTGDGERIDPFTMSDAYSRYLLCCQAVDKADTEQVRGVLEACFREYGLPVAIRSDNGAPFASRAIAGLSRLSVYLMKLGVIVERIDAGHPEQNGRHERMHRTLKAETASPPAANRRMQQKAFDHFRRESNEERPHEALGQRTPSCCYSVSPRAYPERVPTPQYDSTMLVRHVRPHGAFSWRHQDVFLSETLAGEAIALQPVNERYYRIYFASFPIAQFDSHTCHAEGLRKETEESKSAEP
jgi:transposase InsO family protein